MKQTYIILLKNTHLKFQSDLPKKQGHYMKEVRLFKIDANKPTKHITQWIDNNYENEHVTEVVNWD